jgi:SAM-dependent methyltransferase
MSNSRDWVPEGDNALIVDYLPTDHSRQSHCLREALHALDGLSNVDGGIILLDLGCGAGASYDLFPRRTPRIKWIGLDIADSGEVRSRLPGHGPVCTYDGVHIPLRDSAVNIVYSRQVFEHVRHPEPLINEVYRVLKPGAFFVGSTSHLEPFHSRSYWNYTPYGFCALLKEIGFRSIQVRPGIDSLTLIGRRYLSYLRLAKLLDPFFTIESPTNALLEVGLRALAQTTKRRNALKLVFAGQFCFSARK